MVHLSKFAEFCEEMNANDAYVVTLWGKMTNVKKIIFYFLYFIFASFQKAKFSCANQVRNLKKLIFTAVKLSWFTVYNTQRKYIHFLSV